MCICMRISRQKKSAESFVKLMHSEVTAVWKNGMCVCVYVCICAFACMYVYLISRIHYFLLSCTHTCIHTYIAYSYMHTHIHIHTAQFEGAFLLCWTLFLKRMKRIGPEVVRYVCMYAYVYVCANACILFLSLSLSQMANRAIWDLLRKALMQVG